MNQEQNLAIAQDLLSRIGQGESPQQVAELFAENLEWNIPGDINALPWLGKRHGRQAVITFVERSQELIERKALEVHDILANENRVIIVGALISTYSPNNKDIETPFAISLTISDGVITNFLMLEDSFVVSQACRTEK